MKRWREKGFRAWHRLIDPPLYRAARLVCRALGRFSPRWRSIWIVCETGTEARDNGYHFFRYLRQTRPDINAYYLIAPSSPDYPRVTALGKTVAPHTLGHYLRFAGADALISTHVYGYIPKGLFHPLDRDTGLIQSKKIFLQHGIILNSLPWCYASNCRLDLFVCGAKREWEALRRETGFSDDVLRFLGLCRYDRLMQPHETKKQVLLIPTWRRYIPPNANRQQFCETPYYQRYQALLNSAALRDLLVKYGYRLVFYPHRGTLPYLEHFSTPFEEVTIASHQDHDVQDLLMESAVMITDYSSVFFDFGYMNKPVVYYQFDQELFHSTQYQQGYFSYEKDGFGPVVKEEAELLSALEALLREGLSAEYRRRVEAFFPEHNDGNCERNLNTVLALFAKEA